MANKHVSREAEPMGRGLSGKRSRDLLTKSPTTCHSILIGFPRSSNSLSSSAPMPTVPIAQI